MFNLSFLEQMFAGAVSPEDIKAAYQEMRNGTHAHTKYNKNLLQLTMDDGTQASISMRPADGIETFRCNCGHKGATFCKHFIFLMSAASEIAAGPSTSGLNATSDSLSYDIPNLTSDTLSGIAAIGAPTTGISTLEYKVSRSKSVPPELKASFKKFKKVYSTLYREYKSSSTKREINRNHKKLFDARNELIDKCLDTAHTIRQSDSAIGSLETLLYSFFNFCKIVGYNNEEMLWGFVRNFEASLHALYSKTKAAEKRQMWDFIAQSLRVEDTRKLPRDPVLQSLIDFITENYDTNKYYNENLNLLDDLIDNALYDKNDYMAERWAMEYLYLLEDSGISEDELYNEYREWWEVPSIRLNYLEHCMEERNYFPAYTLANDCLKEEYLFSSSDINRLHEIILGASYKLNKFDRTIEESEYLAESSPDSLLYELQLYLRHDEKRWPKIESRITPILEKAENNLE